MYTANQVAHIHNNSIYIVLLPTFQQSVCGCSACCVVVPSPVSTIVSLHGYRSSFNGCVLVASYRVQNGWVGDCLRHHPFNEEPDELEFKLEPDFTKMLPDDMN